MEKSQSQRKKAVKFTDLDAWKYGHSLVVEVYKMTKSWPKDEQYGLTSQIRRAAISITSNIAEGFSRATKIDKKHFYTMSHGSLTELQNQSLVARDIGYITKEEFQSLADTTITVHKLLTGLIKSLKE